MQPELMIGHISHFLAPLILANPQSSSQNASNCAPSPLTSLPKPAQFTPNQLPRQSPPVQRTATSSTVSPKPSSSSQWRTTTSQSLQHFSGSWGIDDHCPQLDDRTHESGLHKVAHRHPGAAVIVVVTTGMENLQFLSLAQDDSQAVIFQNNIIAGSG